MTSIATVGVLLLDEERFEQDELTSSPGDAGLGDQPQGFFANPATWNCNTVYRVARGCPAEATANATAEGAEALRRAAKELDGKVDVITSDCAYTWFTPHAFEGITTPVVASSFAFLELARSMSDSVAVVVSHTPTVLRLMGTVPEGVRLVGLEHQPEWMRFHTEDYDASNPLSQKKLGEELAERLRADAAEHGSPGACVLECSGLPQFYAVAREVYGAPVFDVVSFIHRMLDVPFEPRSRFAT